MSSLIVGGSAGLIAMNAGAASMAQNKESTVNGGTAEDQISIGQLIYTYAMAIDNLDAVSFSDCFAENAVLWGKNPPSPDFELKGKSIASVIDWHRHFTFTMHNVQNYLYTIRGRAAQGTTYCIASLVLDSSGTREKTDLYIRYRDALTRNGGRWQFINRQVQMFVTTTVPVQQFTPDGAGERPGR